MFTNIAAAVFALFSVPRNFHALRSRFVIDETCKKFNISEIITHFSSSMCERVVTLAVKCCIIAPISPIKISLDLG